MKKEHKDKKRNSEELLEIWGRLEKRGFVSNKEGYFDLIKTEILKREQQEINRLKQEMDTISKQKFGSKDEFIRFLEQLFPGRPPSYPAI